MEINIMLNKTALVLGAGGFIGNHMVTYLTKKGYWVRGVDIKYPEFSPTLAADFVQGDLRDISLVKQILTPPVDIINTTNSRSFDEIYQFAADMGGAGFVFTGENDADIMHNSASINLNLLDAIAKGEHTGKIFYSSSACIYPEHNQLDSANPICEESTAYPANPDSEYGWEKLFSERLFFAYARNHDLTVKVARYHNIYGPEGTWDGGREKSPAAICRKVALANPTVEIWGSGNQTRSFLYIDDCIEATYLFMQSGFQGPINIGSEEMVTINQLVDLAADIAKKPVIKQHVPGPVGVAGRRSHNDLIRSVLNWEPRISLKQGLTDTYKWIKTQLDARNN